VIIRRNVTCISRRVVNLRFTSTLTPEDENAMVPAVLQTLTSILDLVPIAYVLRIDTSDGHVYEHRGPAAPAAAEVVPAMDQRVRAFES